MNMSSRENNENVKEKVKINKYFTHSFTNSSHVLRYVYKNREATYVLTFNPYPASIDQLG